MDENIKMPYHDFGLFGFLQSPDAFFETVIDESTFFVHQVNM